MTTDDQQIEARLREALSSGARAEVAEPPPFRPSVPAPVIPSRGARRLLVATGVVVVAALAVVTATVLIDREDKPDRVTAIEPPVTDEPLLGPLPYLGFAPGGPTIRSVTASLARDDVYDGYDSNWWDQTFQSERGTADPATLHIMTVRQPASGPEPLDDVDATFTEDATEPVVVQGTPARLLRQGSHHISVWWPSGGPSGTVIKGSNLSAEQVTAIAEGLRPRPNNDGWNTGDLPASLVPVKDDRRVSEVAAVRWHAQIDFAYAPGSNGSLTLVSGSQEMVPPIPENPGDVIDLDVLGQPATAYVNDDLDIAQVVWMVDDVVATVFIAEPGVTIDVFRDVVGALRVQTEAQWIAALPPSSLTMTQAADTIRDLGATTPLPGGGHLTELRRPPAPKLLIESRESVLGEAVIQARCAWIDHWVAATEDGNSAAAAEAITALEGAGTWGVLAGLEERMRSGMLADFALPLADMRAGDLAAIQQRNGTPAGC